MSKTSLAHIARAAGLGAALLMTASVTSGCVVHPVPRAAAVVHVKGAPPPVRREVVVARPSHRHVWVRGHWVHRHRDWVWISGAWKVPPRDKAVWVAPKYHRRGGGWVVSAGYWR
ncbi:MAG: hypothetical protein AAGN66_12890 [Acidobacteriota bacterium]